MTSNYERDYARALSDPNGFWAEAAERVDWYKRWDKVLDDSNPPFYRWFAGGEVNTCYNALDRHVEAGRGDQAALIYDSPATDTKTRFTYTELRDLVALCAGALANQGVIAGDRVLIYMPMIPEAVISMLALRPARRDPLGRVRRLCGERTRDAHRRRETQGHDRGQLRHRAGSAGGVQAAARRSD